MFLSSVPSVRWRNDSHRPPSKIPPSDDTTAMCRGVRAHVQQLDEPEQLGGEAVVAEHEHEVDESVGLLGERDARLTEPAHGGVGLVGVAIDAGGEQHRKGGREGRAAHGSGRW